MPVPKVLGRWRLLGLSLGLFLVVVVSFVTCGLVWAGPEDTAYQHNREGMIAMGMARFDEAIRSFLKASALVEDYQIRGKKLEYTPVFHTGWARQKIGLTREACGAFERFLSIVPKEDTDGTKIDHAQGYIRENC